MKFGRIVGLGLALLGSAVAHAQFSVYGIYEATRHTGVNCLDTRGCANGAGYNQNGSVNATGGWGGVSYDWKQYGPAMIGFDVRAGESHGNKSGTANAGGHGSANAQNVLGGVKATFRTPIRVVKPYGQISLGWSRSNITEPLKTYPTILNPTPPLRYDNFFVVQGFAGVDIRLAPVLDLRLVELSYGNMQRMGGQGSSSVGLLSAGVGVVFHFPSPH
ncbi:hypothetical protein ACFQBQ_15455 [Granulicella cerasi]|uniref:Outer membrane protein beta-barrel domain-containing protein n=1 Tax=Granulicella cerasi TaxID=741063 RepID=A0ABW1ZDK8_9BACT|nr:hypothetical protein [Granulicella cerasi]